MNHLTPSENYQQLTFATANLLAELPGKGVRPQSERLDAFVESFQTIQDDKRHAGRPIDLIALQEVQGVSTADYLRTQMGMNDMHAYAHSRKKSLDEHIATISRETYETESFRLDYNRIAVVTHIGMIAVYNIHLIYSDPVRRASQFGELQERVADDKYAVVMGDFNDIPLYPIRSNRHRLEKEAGLTSAFVLKHKIRPVTLPTPEYVNLRSLKTRAFHLAMGGGVQLDDILVKGLEVDNVGSIDSDTDHRILHTTIRTEYGDAPS